MYCKLWEGGWKKVRVTSPQGVYIVRGDMEWEGEGGGSKTEKLGWYHLWMVPNYSRILKQKSR